MVDIVAPSGFVKIAENVTLVSKGNPLEDNLIIFEGIVDIDQTDAKMSLKK